MNAIKINLDNADNQKLEALILFGAKPSNKSTYALWVRHFDIGRGKGSEIEFEAMLSSSPEDGLNPYDFPLVNHLAKGKRLALGLCIWNPFSLD